MKKRMILSLVYWIGGAVLLLVLGVGMCYYGVSRNASGRTYEDVAEIPHYRTGVLLGTSPRTAKGAINNHFANRIKATEELYKAGKVDVIIASGGANPNTGYDEPQAMKDSLVARGIPEDKIILDYDGNTTKMSVMNAKNEFKLDSVVFISQKFHNERAIYMADAYGINAIGYNAAPTHVTYVRYKNYLREALARVKMYLSVFKGS